MTQEKTTLSWKLIQECEPKLQQAGADTILYFDYFRV